MHSREILGTYHTHCNPYNAATEGGTKERWRKRKDEEKERVKILVAIR